MDPAWILWTCPFHRNGNIKPFQSQLGELVLFPFSSESLTAVED